MEEMLHGKGPCNVIRISQSPCVILNCSLESIVGTKWKPNPPNPKCSEFSLVLARPGQGQTRFGHVRVTQKEAGLSRELMGTGVEVLWEGLYKDLLYVSSIKQHGRIWAILIPTGAEERGPYFGGTAQTATQSSL